MTSIITAAFKATIGLLVNKGRDKAAEKLKEGDVTDQKIRDLIVREIDDIKSKLDGLARKDLLSAIDAYEVGLKYLYQAIDAEAAAATIGARKRKENLEKPSSPSTTATVKTIALAAEMTNMELTEFSETTKKSLSEAKERFKMAREEATRAFNNEALSTFDRITAIRYRAMGTILESAVGTVLTAGDLSSLSVKSAMETALPECEQCLQKLHSLPDVKNNFKVELEKGVLNIKGRFGKDERREIISAVCQVNRAIYDASQTAGKSVLIWPSVDIGTDKIDPLRDSRVTEVLRKVGMEHCCVPWSFGQEREEEHKLIHPCGIATNTDGQFIIADGGDITVKVFSSSGKFLHSFKPQTDDADTELDILDVATNLNNSNIYVLVGLRKPGTVVWELEMHVYQNSGDRLNKFPVRRGGWGRLTVSSNKVLVLGWNGWTGPGGYRPVRRGDWVYTGPLDEMRTDECDDGVYVYNHDGGYVCSFGEGILKEAWDITTVPDGSVMVLDGGDDCVHVFTEDGTQLNKFNINTKGKDYTMASHPAGEHVVIACREPGTGHLRVDIYTKNGEFVRAIALDEERLTGITVTIEGHIAVAVESTLGSGKVIVI